MIKFLDAFNIAGALTKLASHASDIFNITYEQMNNTMRTIQICSFNGKNKLFNETRDVSGIIQTNGVDCKIKMYMLNVYKTNQYTNSTDKIAVF